MIPAKLGAASPRIPHRAHKPPPAASLEPHRYSVDCRCSPQTTDCSDRTATSARCWTSPDPQTGCPSSGGYRADHRRCSATTCRTRSAVHRFSRRRPHDPRCCSAPRSALPSPLHLRLRPPIPPGPRQAVSRSPPVLPAARHQAVLRSDRSPSADPATVRRKPPHQWHHIQHLTRPTFTTARNLRRHAALLGLTPRCGYGSRIFCPDTVLQSDDGPAERSVKERWRANAAAPIVSASQRGWEGRDVRRSAAWQEGGCGTDGYVSDTPRAGCPALPR